MSKQPLIMFAICLLCILQLSCTTVPATKLTTPAQISTWNTALPGSEGKLLVQFKLPAHAKSDLLFSNRTIDDYRFAPIRLSLNNENCTNGHLVSLNYKNGANTTFSKYFAQEARWSKSNTLIITWDTEQKMTASLNDETIQVEIEQKIRQLAIISYSAPIEIEKFEYLPQP
jgi:hypothetical protein